MKFTLKMNRTVSLFRIVKKKENPQLQSSSTLKCIKLANGKISENINYFLHGRENKKTKLKISSFDEHFVFKQFVK